MRLLVADKAAVDIEDIFAWIAADNPRAARAVVNRIEKRILNLARGDLPYIGRKGREPGTRELIVRPYIVVYAVDEARQQITVHAVFHGAQDR